MMWIRRSKKIRKVKNSPDLSSCKNDPDQYLAGYAFACCQQQKPITQFFNIDPPFCMGAYELVVQYQFIMSIVLRANELNTIIYKYLLECGLSHTAYSLFNEAALTQPLQEYRFDIRPGHLLSLLEKALVYAQIESHVNLSQYVECEEPFGLLRAHTCKVVERARKEKEELMREFGQQINDSIKRTNSAYNAAIANRDYDEIVYDPKGAKYLQKFTKIRIPADSYPSHQFVLKGSAQTQLLHNRQDFEVDLLRYDGLNEQVVIEQIFPCVSQGQLESPLDFACAGEYLVQLFSRGRVTAFRLADEELVPFQFMLDGEIADNEKWQLLPNGNLPQLVTIAAGQQFWVVNLNTMKLVKHGRGAFTWKQFDEYLLILPDKITVNVLSSQEPLLTIPSEHSWGEVSFNPQKNLYSIFSPTECLVHINTFQSPQPLFIFDFSSDVVKQTLWVCSNNVDYFCWLSEGQIKVFDLSLNMYSKVIELSEFDSTVSAIAVVKKADREECYLVGLGSVNILFYDIGNAKIERIEVAGRAELFPLGNEKLALVMDSCIYFLVGQLIEPLFK